MASNTLGILTGISYVSGLDYFKGINEKVLALTPIRHIMSPNPSIVMVSVDCDKYVSYLMESKFDEVSSHLLSGVHRLVAAGCDILVIASNTGHIAATTIEIAYPNLKLLHIADCCGCYLKSKGYSNVGLIGTKPTMEEDYLKSRLALHGVRTVVPDLAEMRNEIYRIIIEELSYSKFVETSRQELISVICGLRDRGAEACILGCTEIELLLHNGDVDGIELIPSAELHIDMTANILLGKMNIDDVLPTKQEV